MGIPACVFDKGDRVTGELPSWYDGEPVASWPNPHYIGTVKRTEFCNGCWNVWVAFDSGRKENVRADRLFLVARKGA